MSGTEEEREEDSLLGALEPERRLGEGSVEDDRSILAEFNHIREHIETLEEAARAARGVEFEQIRAVVAQLEAVAAAARAVERDLSMELADTRRLSVATARLVRDRLATALRALAEALVTADRAGEQQFDSPSNRKQRLPS